MVISLFISLSSTAALASDFRHKWHARSEGLTTKPSSLEWEEMRKRFSPVVHLMSIQSNQHTRCLRADCCSTSGCCRGRSRSGLSCFWTGCTCFGSRWISVLWIWGRGGVSTSSRTAVCWYSRCGSFHFIWNFQIEKKWFHREFIRKRRKTEKQARETCKQVLAREKENSFQNEKRGLIA